MTQYGIAWLIASVCGVLLAALVFSAARRWTMLRLLLAGLTLVLALTPYRFDDAYTAPAFIVALFRLVFERDADPTGAILALGAAVFGALAVWLLAVAGRAVAMRLGRGGTSRGGKSRRRDRANTVQ